MLVTRCNPDLGGRLIEYKPIWLRCCSVHLCCVAGWQMTPCSSKMTCFQIPFSLQWTHLLHVVRFCQATKPEQAAIILWDTSTWRPQCRLQSHTLTVTQLAFSHSGTLLLSVSRDRTWSLFTRRPTPDDNSGLFLIISSSFIHYIIFMYLLARDRIYAIVRYMPSPFRLSVRLFVTWVDQSNTVEVRIMQPLPQSSPMTLSFLTLNFTVKFQREDGERGRRIREG